MRRAAKIGVVAAASVVGVLAAAVSTIYGVSAAQLRRTFPLPPTATLSVPVGAADAGRGEHLVRSVSLCIECHGDDLGGKIFADAGPLGILVGPNLTSGAGGVGPSYADEDWVLAIRHGLRRDGRSLLVMPSEAYVHYGDADLAAIIAYVKSLPPIDRELPATRLRLLGRALLATGNLPIQVAAMTPALESRAQVEPGLTAEYGAFLARVGGCTGCHGPDLTGGIESAGPGSLRSSNITPAGIGAWTEPDFMRALREGVRPNGSAIDEKMPWRYMAGMTDEELQALWLYLQTVPAKETVIQS